MASKTYWISFIEEELRNVLDALTNERHYLHEQAKVFRGMKHADDIAEEFSGKATLMLKLMGKFVK